MFTFLRRKKPLRFVLISTLLAGAAVGAGLIAAVAGQSGQLELAALSSKVALGLAIIIVLYAAPQLARSVQWQSDYAMHVTNTGLVFSAAILIVTILALSSGNNLLYLVLAALLATMTVSILAARWNLKRLSASAHYPDHIFAAEPVTFEVTLQSNKRLLPSFSLSVDLVEEHQQPASPVLPVLDAALESKTAEQKVFALAYFPMLPARAHARMRIERRFDKRGVYPVTGFIVSTGFPFGFITQRRFIEWRGEVVVYPPSCPLDDFAHLLPFAQGRIESRAKGSGSDLYAIRPYLSSDHHHHLDWKATAKTGRLMVREFTRDDDWRITIRFDSQVDEQIADPLFHELFERAVIFAASLITYFVESGAEVRLVISDVDSGFGLGSLHRFEMLRALAQASPQLVSAASRMSEPNSIDEWAASPEILITPNSSKSLPSPNTASTHVISFEELS